MLEAWETVVWRGVAGGYCWNNPNIDELVVVPCALDAWQSYVRLGLALLLSAWPHN